MEKKMEGQQKWKSQLLFLERKNKDFVDAEIQMFSPQ